jgi:small subunit ribosomal protein S21
MSRGKTIVAVKVIKGNIQKALSKFKRKVKDSEHLKELRERKQFTKPSVLKRRQKQVAIYNQKLEDLKTKDE